MHRYDVWGWCDHYGGPTYASKLEEKKKSIIIKDRKEQGVLRIGIKIKPQEYV